MSEKIFPCVYNLFLELSLTSTHWRVNIIADKMSVEFDGFSLFSLFALFALFAHARAVALQAIVCVNGKIAKPRNCMSALTSCDSGCSTEFFMRESSRCLWFISLLQGFPDALP